MKEKIILTTEIEDVEANVNFMGLGKTTPCAGRNSDKLIGITSHNIAKHKTETVAGENIHPKNYHQWPASSSMVQASKSSTTQSDAII